MISAHDWQGGRNAAGPSRNARAALFKNRVSAIDTPSNLFHHLVGGDQQGERHGEAERLRRLLLTTVSNLVPTCTMESKSGSTFNEINAHSEKLQKFTSISRGR
jgi:hypothetical protein